MCRPLDHALELGNEMDAAKSHWGTKKYLDLIESGTVFRFPRNEHFSTTTTVSLTSSPAPALAGHIITTV
jgi:hypothetical protein